MFRYDFRLSCKKRAKNVQKQLFRSFDPERRVNGENDPNKIVLSNFYAKNMP